MTIMTIRIKSLEELKAWNENPTTEAPIVLEWFMDWFFDELLEKSKREEAMYAREALIEFTVICEKMTREAATKRVDSNFNYYSGRGYTLEWVELEEMMLINNTPVKDLPLLIGTIKHDKNKTYFEQKLNRSL